MSITKNNPGRASKANFYEGQIVWTEVPIEKGAILIVTELRNARLYVEPAQPTCDGRLLVAAHGALPGEKASKLQAVPWLVVEDATSAEKPPGSSVYLGKDGRFRFTKQGAGRKVGRVLKGGAVLLDPNAP